MVGFCVFIDPAKNKSGEADINALRLWVKFRKVNIDQCPNCSEILFIYCKIIDV